MTAVEDVFEIDGVSLSAFEKSQQWICPSLNCECLMFKTSNDLNQHLKLAHNIQLVDPGDDFPTNREDGQEKFEDKSKSSPCHVIATHVLNPSPSNSVVVESSEEGNLCSVVSEDTEAELFSDVSELDQKSKEALPPIKMELHEVASLELVSQRLQRMIEAGIPHQHIGEALPEGWSVDVHEREDRPARFQSYVTPEGLQFPSVIAAVDHIKKQVTAARAAAASLPKADSAAVASPPNLIVPMDFICPLRNKIFVDPVIFTDGHTYEREAILESFQSTGCALPASNDLVPNRLLKALVEDWCRVTQQPSTAMSGPTKVDEIKSSAAAAVAVAVADEGATPRLSMRQGSATEDGTKPQKRSFDTAFDPDVKRVHASPSDRSSRDGSSRGPYTDRHGHNRQGVGGGCTESSRRERPPDITRRPDFDRRSDGSGSVHHGDRAVFEGGRRPSVSSHNERERDIGAGPRRDDRFVFLNDRDAGGFRGDSRPPIDGRRMEPEVQPLPRDMPRDASTARRPEFQNSRKEADVHLRDLSSRPDFDDLPRPGAVARAGHRERDVPRHDLSKLDLDRGLKDVDRSRRDAARAGLNDHKERDYGTWPDSDERRCDRMDRRVDVKQERDSRGDLRTVRATKHTSPGSNQGKGVDDFGREIVPLKPRNSSTTGNDLVQTASRKDDTSSQDDRMDRRVDVKQDRDSRGDLRKVRATKHSSPGSNQGKSVDDFGREIVPLKPRSSSSSSSTTGNDLVQTASRKGDTPSQDRPSGATAAFPRTHAPSAPYQPAAAAVAIPLPEAALLEHREYVTVGQDLPFEELRSCLQGDNHENINHIEEECGVQLRLRGSHLLSQKAVQGGEPLHFYIRAKHLKAMNEAREVIKDLLEHALE